ncbi:MAG TPA: PIN domain-containing protein [Actinomycetota bacterium]|nr:PIN domain-containing protein [Actinomycetota bacterium]HNL52003.1 PIN domain-containing protein [Actinomycetota bacterium]HNM95851.1 PIN domain-containing protein [Mycobacterium sp.]
MTRFALDSSAMVAWMRQEAGRWRAVDALLNAPGAQPVLPGPALTECIVVARRAGNTSSPEQIATTLSAMGVTVEPPRDVDMLRAAGLLEDSWAHPGRHPASSVTLSFGDALILAVVERLGVKVLTADRYWVQVAAEGVTSAVVVQL